MKNLLRVVALLLPLVTWTSLANAIHIEGPSTFIQGLPDQYFVTLLIVCGMLLMLAELKITSYGVLGIGGVACMVGACFILMRTGQSLFGVPPVMVIPVLVAITVIELMLVVVSIRSTKGIPSTGMDSFVGEIAEVSRALSPEGKVFFNGAHWNAVSSVPVPLGEKVRILSADRMQLTVRPLTAEFADTGVGIGAAG